jgi:hypothetical protein
MSNYPPPALTPLLTHSTQVPDSSLHLASLSLPQVVPDMNLLYTMFMFLQNVIGNLVVASMLRLPLLCAE